ncbi:hypothetical protein COLO4_07114 [Corchorus olitorius]|uniref:Uncharacterized protein n=1 Tax=Corchorus olitorius TaxID=93759 RepID=A0A1R3KKV4_9ROSI|nr:hypothetical protein COLO4_07114 [Corchorus olitorius]
MAFAKRAGVIRNKRGKKKELSPQDAATMIQITFRAYLICRSQAPRALRDLAVAKTKLKEIRAYFNNFNYRRRVAQDAAKRQNSVYELGGQPANTMLSLICKNKRGDGKSLQTD